MQQIPSYASNSTPVQLSKTAESFPPLYNFELHRWSEAAARPASPLSPVASSIPVWVESSLQQTRSATL
jgi:hypothetical protein